MLTDYHVHLREDEDLEPPEHAAFTSENVDRYLAAAEAAGIEELGCSEHVYRFADALRVWQHPFWEEQARDALPGYWDFVRGTPWRFALGVDFFPGPGARTASLLEEHDFDY